MIYAPSFFPALLICMQQEPPILWEWTGSQSADGFGWAVQGVGDLDSDGFDDVAVGAPLYDVGALVDAGQVKVFSGATGGFLHVWNGNSVPFYPGLGGWLAALEDLNGDGIPEVGASPPVRVFSGGDGSVLLAQPKYGPLGAVGDVDGDSTPDLVHGDPFFTVYSGFAEVLSGASGVPLFTVTGSLLFEEWFGRSVSGLGDLNGDGVPDFVVGAPGDILAAQHLSGYVKAFSGSNGQVLWTAPGRKPTMQYGYSVAGMGDVNGDGIRDMAVGAPHWHPTLNGPTAPMWGMVQVLSGATGTLLRSFPGVSAFSTSALGIQVAAPGDVDGDGFEEVVGASCVGVFLFSTAPGNASPLWEPTSWTSLYFPGGSCHKAAEAGDANADGFPDIVLGSPGDYITGNPPGKTRVLSGAPLGVTTFGSGCAGSTGAPPRSGATVKAKTGTAFKVHLSRTIVGANAVLILGFSETAWWGIPLPLNLGFLGLPGCALHVSADFLIPTMTTNAQTGGRATVSIPIPSDPGLIGQRFYAQWYVADPGPSPLPGAMTRALRALIH